MRERAYFTPTPEEVAEIQRHLLFGQASLPVSVEFNTETEDGLRERRMRVTEVCASIGGYAIWGQSTEAEGGRTAVVRVDTTVDPPVAVYEIAEEA